MGETVPISGHATAVGNLEPELPTPSSVPLPVIEAFEALLAWFRAHDAARSQTAALGSTGDLIIKLEHLIAHLKAGQ
jgi:hypothetical protein